MKGSVIFYVLVALSFLTILLVIRYPHYSPEGEHWYLGQSIGSRILNGKEDGVPIDKLVRVLISSSVTSPLELTCSSNADCESYTVTNQCRMYCGNSSPGNNASITLLNNNIACDPSSWNARELICSCVQGKCINLE